MPNVPSELLPFLTPQQRAELDLLLAHSCAWNPYLGPQTAAYHSEADILFYGGAAGGGKTDLLLGLARREHHRSIIFRRLYNPSLRSVIDRSQEIFGREIGAYYNESIHRWRWSNGRTIRFGGLEHEDDRLSWQGQAHDYYGFDEITEFSESQFRFVIGWNRSARPGQRCRVVCTGNPPTDSDGEWVIRFFAPWLDEAHPNPAKPGELRWFTTYKGKDIELPNGDPVVLDGVTVYPRSRTFIPARLQDNPALLASGYMSQLQALPEPLRSKMLLGDFKAGREDNAWQVIPSAWVDAAQQRWRERVAKEGKPKTPLSTVGADIARGGSDSNVFALRYDNFIDELLVYPGKSTPDGPAVAALLLPLILNNKALAQIDVIGVGASVYDCLRSYDKLRDRIIGMNSSEASEVRDESGQLGFTNQRSEWWWKAREALDPKNGQDICLPPDAQLKADLCAPHWKPTARGIQIESKNCGKPRGEGQCCIKHRLGRSPDRGDTVVYALAQKIVPGMGVFNFMQGLAAEKAKKQEEARNGKQG